MYQSRFQERSVLMVILLSLVTCGIYSIYWWYKTNDDLNAYTGDNRINPGLALFFTLITCGIYGIYWWYKMAELETRAQQMNGKVIVGDNKILFLVLAIFGLSIVNMAILQADLNQIYATDNQVPPTTPNQFSQNQYGQNPYNQQQNQNHDDDEWTDY